MTTVLIVDDSRAARMMLKHWLKAVRPDYSVLEAGNAEEAMGHAPSLSSGDLAVLDYNMPGEDGITLASKLLSHMPSGRITLCTANIQDAVRKRAEDLGLSYMTKPLNPGKVKSILSEAESHS